MFLISVCKNFTSQPLGSNADMNINVGDRHEIELLQLFYYSPLALIQTGFTQKNNTDVSSFTKATALWLTACWELKWKLKYLFSRLMGLGFRNWKPRCFVSRPRSVCMTVSTLLCFRLLSHSPIHVRLLSICWRQISNDLRALVQNPLLATSSEQILLFVAFLSPSTVTDEAS